MQSMLLNAAGHSRSQATCRATTGTARRGTGVGNTPSSAERRGDPRGNAKVDDRAEGHHRRALIVLLWRAGYESAKRLPFRRATLTAAAVPCSSDTGRATDTAKSS